MTLKWKKTCNACPEQYDIFDSEGSQVGYFRLRHGYLAVMCPGVGGEEVYESSAFSGDGSFIEENERLHHCYRAEQAILLWMFREKFKHMGDDYV
jgi:hypothetical protein